MPRPPSGRSFYLNPTLQSQFPKRDSIAWGNLFDASLSVPFIAHVCHFDELYNACNSVVDVITNRTCDEEPGGNLALEGSCDTACTWDSSGYWSCGNMQSFRVRLKDFDMYGIDCAPPP